MDIDKISKIQDSSDLLPKFKSFSNIETIIAKYKEYLKSLGINDVKMFKLRNNAGYKLIFGYSTKVEVWSISDGMMFSVEDMMDSDRVLVDSVYVPEAANDLDKLNMDVVQGMITQYENYMNL